MGAQLLGRVWDFAVAVAWNWVGLVCGVAFAVESVIEYFVSEKWRGAIDTRWPRDRRRRGVLWLCMGLLFIAAFQAYDNLKTSSGLALNERADRACAKILVSRALHQADGFFKERKSAEHSDFERRVNDWADTTAHFIESAFGEGEARLFSNGSGITTWSGSSNPNQPQYVALQVYTQRLAELIPRIDTIPMELNFHPECEQENDTAKAP